jgi:hypothetical protein
LKLERQLWSEVHGLLPSFAIKFNFEERFFSYLIRQNSALDDSLRHDGMQRRNTRESKTSDLTYANRMLDGSITISVRSTKSASTQEFVDSQAGFDGGIRHHWKS